MLTADENLVDVVFAVQYRIADPAAWLFQVRDPEGTVRTVGESAVREVDRAQRSNLSVLTRRPPPGTGPGADAYRCSQMHLNRYHAGVIIDAVQIQSANPPAQVAPAYQDVARAGEDAQSAGVAANAYATKATGDAQSAAAKITLAASTYQQQIVHEANGEASRFDQIYGQYRRAPAVTRERMYIQTMQDVLAPRPHRDHRDQGGDRAHHTAAASIPVPRPAERAIDAGRSGGQSEGASHASFPGLSSLIAVAAAAVLIHDQHLLHRRPAPAGGGGEPRRPGAGDQSAGRSSIQGLKVKIPFSRRSRGDSRQAQPGHRGRAGGGDLSSDQQRLVVDAFVRYRIDDPLAFYRTLRNETIARDRLEP